MLRVEADIQMINSQIKNGPGQAVPEGGLAGPGQRRQRDSTMDKIEALLQPNARPAEGEPGSAAGSNGLNYQAPTLSTLQSASGAQEANDAYAQASRPAPSSATQLQQHPGGPTSGPGPARYRAPPSIGDIQAAFKIDARSNTPIGTTQ